MLTVAVPQVYQRAQSQNTQDNNTPFLIALVYICVSSISALYYTQIQIPWGYTAIPSVHINTHHKHARTHNTLLSLLYV